MSKPGLASYDPSSPKVKLPMGLKGKEETKSAVTRPPLLIRWSRDVPLIFQGLAARGFGFSTEEGEAKS